MGKLLRGLGTMMVGGLIVSPTGRAWIKEATGGTQEVIHENGPTVVDATKDAAGNAKNLAPKGMLGQTAIPMDTVPITTVQGLSK